MIEHKNTSLAIKCVKQSYHSPNELVSMMETFRQMVNYCIKIGMEERTHVNAASLKHTIRGIVRNLVKKGVVVRVRAGTYKKA